MPSAFTWTTPPDEISVRYHVKELNDNYFQARISVDTDGWSADVRFAGTVRHAFRRGMYDQNTAKAWAEKALKDMKEEVAPLIEACKKLKPGLHFARRTEQSAWELIELRAQPPVLVAYTMGWDCSEDIGVYDISSITPANIIDPDGKPYSK